MTERPVENYRKGIAIMSMNKKLEVRDVRISFRTVAGRLKAVRGINFDLMEGETLAIVGESGSGKSVTSKAILGILAGNSIVEGGEILYDGMDLLKISEDDFYRIRGDKIAMIFQDPLSSLNPIMRIGKQLTEAMLLKNKARQKASRKAFNDMLHLLNENMIEVSAKNDPEKAKELTKKCKDFDKFEFKHIELEKAYNEAFDAATEAISDLEDVLFLMEKKAVKNDVHTIREIMTKAAKAEHTYVLCGSDAASAKECAKTANAGIREAARSKDYTAVSEACRKLKGLLEQAVAKEEPNFFAMGYYLTFADKPLPDLPVGELNAFTHEYLDKNYMLDFIGYVEASLKNSAEVHNEKKRKVCESLKAAVEKVRSGELVHSELSEMTSALSKEVAASIDPLEIRRDSIAATFPSSLKEVIDVHFEGMKKNAAEEKRYAREKAKYDSFVQKNNYSPDWKPVPAAIAQPETARANILALLNRLLNHYGDVLKADAGRDYHREAIAVIDYLKDNASNVVNRLTRSMAKVKALKLMEEVGISEPRKRYRQYPFEFSGGMRQRIVIAIALAADPDILICDEPTTALDVTIQSQILELINKLKRERHLSIIFITHDLGVVANMADKIAVMYAGKIVEYGTASDVFYAPAHPYTWALLASMPDLDTNEKLTAIPGTPPNMIYPPEGDAFAARNQYALKIDFEKEPPMFRISDTHSAATWLLHPDAPKVEPPAIVTERITRMRERSGERHAE